MVPPFVEDKNASVDGYGELWQHRGTCLDSSLTKHSQMKLAEPYLEIHRVFGRATNKTGSGKPLSIQQHTAQIHNKKPQHRPP